MYRNRYKKNRNRKMVWTKRPQKIGVPPEWNTFGRHFCALKHKSKKDGKKIKRKLCKKMQIIQRYFWIKYRNTTKKWKWRHIYARCPMRKSIDKWKLACIIINMLFAGNIHLCFSECNGQRGLLALFLRTRK